MGKQVRMTKGAKSTRRLSVPAMIARAIPPNAIFEIEVQDEGLFYRFVGVGEPDAQTDVVEIPFWKPSG